MKLTIIVSVIAAMKESNNHEPSETAYFTAIQGDVYFAHRLPQGWASTGSVPKGQPYRKAVTITLPDYISDTPFGIRSNYTALDGNADKVFVYCEPIKVDDNIESAIDKAIHTIIISAPTKAGKRENILFTTDHVSKIYSDVHPSQASK